MLVNEHVRAFAPLPSPAQMKGEQPIPPHLAQQVLASRGAVRSILRGENSRLLVVVGPCSVHDPAATLEYAQRLSALAPKLTRLEVLMRVYIDKPRTTVGWRGFLLDPALDGSGDMVRGIRETRALMLAISELGLGVATELLDPFAPQYLFDLVSWACLGARTSESQTHRAMASAVSAPMGFKNGTGGSISLAVNAAVAARTPHTFFTIDEEGRACILHSTGNPDGHVILRGSSTGPNYEEGPAQAAQSLREAGLEAAVLVDCSHANSGRDPARQRVVWEAALSQRRQWEGAGLSPLRGLMLESFLEEGSQSLGAGELRHGVSVTDPCIGWNETEALLLLAQEAQEQAGLGG